MSASPIILLPAEIIASIAREVQPQDLKNFVLTCKAIYLASQDVLKVYRELRKQYRHVGNARKWDNSQVCYHLPELLQRVLESPKLASHVERLSYIEDENDEYRAADFKQLFQDRLENLQISNPERQAWWSDTRENQYKPRANQLMVGLLLRHLPHLETFEWHSMRFRLDLTDLIRPVQLDRAGSRYPLPALKSVSFSAGRYGNVLGKITLKQVLPFLALPNVEHMNIQDFRYSDPPDDLDAAAVPLRGSNLRELILELRKAKILPNLRRLTLRSEANRIMSYSRKIKAVRRTCKASGVEFAIDLPVPRWARYRCDSRGQVSWWRRSHDGYSSADIDRVRSEEAMTAIV